MSIRTKLQYMGSGLAIFALGSMGIIATANIASYLDNKNKLRDLDDASQTARDCLCEYRDGDFIYKLANKGKEIAAREYLEYSEMNTREKIYK